MTALELEGSTPSAWSFSALRDARECPRRSALRASSPARDTHAAAAGGAAPGFGIVRGLVCHAVLERMLDVHREHGGPAWGHAALQPFWRRHFPRGITGLAREEADRQLRRSEGRRDAAFEAQLRREVDEAVPSLATSVSELLRLTLSRASAAERPVALAEVPIEAEIAPGIRWRGRIDAVLRSGTDVTLIDFKTGAPSPSDMEQLTVYACVFDHDNWTREWGTVRRLTVLYARGGVVERDAPTGDALEAERARLVREVTETARRLAASPPEASPAPDRCPRCDVRGRCEAYWSARAAWADPARTHTVDAELSVTEVLAGGRALLGRGDGGSWFVRLGPRHEEVARGLTAGTRIRVVGASAVRRANPGDGPSADLAAELGGGCLVVSGSR